MTDFVVFDTRGNFTRQLFTRSKLQVIIYAIYTIKPHLTHLLISGNSFITPSNTTDLEVVFYQSKYWARLRASALVDDDRALRVEPAEGLGGACPKEGVGGLATPHIFPLVTLMAVRGPQVIVL